MANRNEQCPCGSGKKFKKCCGFKQQSDRQQTRGRLMPGAFAQFATASSRSLASRGFKVLKNDKGMPAPQSQEATSKPDTDITVA
jgi:hypothetical protein